MPPSNVATVSGQPTVETRIGPHQWGRAIRDTDGPQLVVAGPGTGKTEFLVRRAAHLISEVLPRADGVLVLTFSRRAAANLGRRIADSLPRPVTRVAASTFHSFAHRLLEARDPGGMPTLLTGPEQVAVVADLLRREDPTAWPVGLRGLLGSSTLAADVTDFLLRCSERLIGPDRLEELAAGKPAWTALPDFQRTYLAELARRGRIDYGTLVAEAVGALESDDLRRSLAAELPYVIVDEFQDTSPAQAELVDRLSSTHRNITVAGDPYQSVYSFRGAELENVAAFPHRFRGLDGSPARRLVLTTSFRVPAEVLAAALRITSGGELPGAAGPVEPAPHPGVVEAHVFDQASAEAEWIAAEIERAHLLDRLPYGSMAVLVRSKRRLLPELSRALARRAIPHDTPDSRLVDHPSVQLFFDLARAADLHSGDGRTDPHLDAVMRRILLGPLFGLSIAGERDLVRRRRRDGLDWRSLVSLHLGDDGEALAALLGDADWATSLPAFDGFWQVWSSLPQFRRLALDPGHREQRALWSSFAQTLDRQLERDPGVSLLDFWRMTADEDFEATPLLSYENRGRDRVTLTTLHQAKGLEFEIVFVADASEAVFPDLRRGVSLLDTQALSGMGGHATRIRFDLQEEMRLAYTACTRARRRLVWTATAAGIDERGGRPSRFMVTVAGAGSVDELTAPSSQARDPVTPREAQSLLRRLLADPSAPAPRRLAAARVLAHPGRQLWDARRFAGLRLPGPDSGVVSTGFHLSPSQAEAYATCPRNYVFERRLGIGDITSAAASFGSLVHAALEDAESRAMAAGRNRATLDEALEVLDAIWEERADFGSPSFDERWRQKGIEVLRRVYDEWPPDSTSPVALEHDLELEVDGKVWRGRADRIERTSRNTLRIVDYKTGRNMPSKEEAARSVQLGFYLLASLQDASILEQGTPAEAEFWYPRTPLKGWRRSFDPGKLPAIEARLVELGRSIEAEDWTATIGDGCTWCRVQLVCPLWPEGREAFVR